jgi:hypothetical protein
VSLSTGRSGSDRAAAGVRVVGVVVRLVVLLCDGVRVNGVSPVRCKGHSVGVVVLLALCDLLRVVLCVVLGGVEPCMCWWAGCSVHRPCGEVGRGENEPLFSPGAPIVSSTSPNWGTVGLFEVTQRKRPLAGRPGGAPVKAVPVGGGGLPIS